MPVHHGFPDSHLEDVYILPYTRRDLCSTICLDICEYISSSKNYFLTHISNISGPAFPVIVVASLLGFTAFIFLIVHLLSDGSRDR